MIDINHIKIIADVLISKYKQQLQSSDIRNESELYKTSISVDINGSTIAISLNIPEHWVNVEFGRRAGAKFPPPDAIAKWIEIRNIVPDGRNGITKPEHLVYPISRKIARDGIPARKILEGTGLVHTYSDGRYGFAEATDAFKDMIYKELVKQLNQYMMDNIKIIE